MSPGRRSCAAGLPNAKFFADVTIPDMSFYWSCPYCNRDTTITDSFSTDFFVLKLKNAEGFRRFNTTLIVCPNAKCLCYTLAITKHELVPSAAGDRFSQTVLESWSLIPPSSAKVFPDYVPQPIRDDYVEACKIRDLSPKASATLSRRCLQGMIRDFWEIKKARLKDEVDALEEKIDPLTWAAVDGVRKIGNIGAHMEKDINLIVDVEPKEAQLLIELIELLVKDWYETKHQREERLKSIAAVSAEKEAAKKVGGS
jgi:hypothetical protein